MSFIIKNKDLFNKLFKIAQENPAFKPYKDAIYANLLENLQRNIDLYSDDKFTSSNPNTELYLRDLQSPYELLLFLAQNGVLYNNELLSIVHDPAKQINDPRQRIVPFIEKGLNIKKYFQYPANRGNDFRFWVNKDGIAKFIKSLYDNSLNDNKGGKLLKTLLDKILIELNNNAGENTIDPKSANKPETLNPNSQLDAFANPYNLQNPRGTGSTILFAKDIENLNAFKTWLGNLGVINNNQKIDLIENICLILASLKIRTDWLKANAATNNPQLSEIYEYYENQINNFNIQSNCNVEGKGTGSGTDTGTGTGTGYGSGASGNRQREAGDGFDPQNLTQITNSLPLRLDQINIDYITKFFSLLEAVSNQYDKQKYNGFLAQVQSNWNSYTEQLKHNTFDFFDLNQPPLAIMNSLKDQSSYIGALESLQRVVVYTQQAISHLKDSLERGGSISPGALAAFRSQVGSGNAVGSSIAYSNLQKLSMLATNVNQLIQITKGRK